MTSWFVCEAILRFSITIIVFLTYFLLENDLSIDVDNLQVIISTKTNISLKLLFVYRMLLYLHLKPLYYIFRLQKHTIV